MIEYWKHKPGPTIKSIVHNAYAASFINNIRLIIINNKQKLDNDLFLIVVSVESEVTIYRNVRVGVLKIYILSINRPVLLPGDRMKYFLL